jgi:hypothetical protein
MLHSVVEMTDELVPDEVQNFIQRHIDSVAQFEALPLFYISRLIKFRLIIVAIIQKKGPGTLDKWSMGGAPLHRHPL